MQVAQKVGDVVGNGDRTWVVISSGCEEVERLIGCPKMLEGSVEDV